MVTAADVQRIAEAANNPNPLIAQAGRQRLRALAQDQSRFEDREAWLWAQHVSRTWIG